MGINELILDHHPFDVVGWDGYFYPWAFNIRDFEPIVGRMHQPPPVHQTFEGDGFVVCSFCPRPYDFDPNAVPAPYNHSNVDSDEVLYYASSEFMSRKGIEFGSITHHPDGIPHGPHPGRAEASIGAKETNELAVMMDSFRPLKVAKQAMAFEDPSYHQSWIDAQHAGFNPPTTRVSDAQPTDRMDGSRPCAPVSPAALRSLPRVERGDRRLREVRKHQASAHRGALLEQRGPIVGARPRDALDQTPSLPDSPPRAVARTTAIAAVERRDACPTPTRRDRAVRPTRALAPVGVDRHRAERTGSDLPLDHRSDDERADAHRELAQVGARRSPSPSRSPTPRRCRRRRRRPCRARA